MPATNWLVISAIAITFTSATFSTYDYNDTNYIACPPPPLGQPVPIPHPQNCKKFYYCVLGNFVEFQCPSGFYFDRKTRVCNQESIADCYFPTSTPITTTESSDLTTYYPNTNGSTPYNECSNEIFTGYNGSFSSPGFPNRMYSNNLDCFYRISTPIGSPITLQLNYIDVEGSYPDCPYDYVAIYNNSNENENVLIKLCSNSTKSHDISTMSNEVTIHFHTDSSVQRTGFQMSYTTMRTVLPSACGQLEFTGQYSGEILSPGYPYKVYPDNVNCYYTISTPTPGSRINFRINNISLESGDSECMYDYIEIYDKSSTSNDSIARFCKNSEDIQSLTNEVVVVFHTDYNVGGLGFNMTFNEIPALNYNSNNKDKRIVKDATPRRMRHAWWSLW